MYRKKRNCKVRPRIVFRMGERIYIGPVLKEDLPFITVSINDPSIHQFLTILRPMSPEMETAWWEGIASRTSDVVFSIVLAKTDEIIGVMALHKIDHVNGTAETGSWIGRKDLWSNGYGTEAKMLVLEYAFNTLNLRKVKSRVYDFNPRSKRCLEKCGYEEDGGILKQDIYRNGQFRDVYQMAVFKDAFLKVWKKYSAKYLA